MNNASYWKKRFKAIEESQHKRGLKCYANIEEQYQHAQREIEQKINLWYQRFADNNNISLTEARKLLNSDELEELKWDVEEYIRYGKANALNQQWMDELENASAKAHINRLEAIKLQMQQSLEVAFGNQLDTVDETIRDIYREGYMRTAFEIQKGIKAGWNFTTPNERLIGKVINKPWSNDDRTFSDRIWINKKKLINELNTTFTQGIITGTDPQKTIDMISKRLAVSKQQTGRLVMTEQAAFSNAAQNDCFKELGVEEFEIVETLDSHTCEYCGSMDGKHFPMIQFEIGMTAPPFHPNCRGCTCPYFDDEFTLEEKRSARSRDDEKTYFVPADMTYREWEKAFVQGDKSDLQAANSDVTIKVQEKISDQNTKIDDLKQQFSAITGGYSYDEWFKDFKSIEEGYGETPNGDETFDKLKALDKRVRNVSTKRSKLLKQKERRGQLDTGYKGKIQDDELDAFNKRALEQIKLDTGYSDEKAKEFQDALKEYFGGDYGAILSGETQTAKVIRDGLDLMPVYDGGISRGMTLNNSDVTMFSNLKIGDELPQRGIIESWTSENGTAIGYSGISDYERSSVILECENNETAVGVQHLSLFGTDESEVLSSSKYEVVEMITENKYDYLSKHKEYLYFPEDLEDEKAVLKENVVCIIKVKEKS